MNSQCQSVPSTKGDTVSELTFTANDVEALIAALYRLPDLYYVSLNPSDMDMFRDCLEHLEDRNTIPMGDTPETSPVWQGLRDFCGAGNHPKQTIVNVLGVLYIVAFGKHFDDDYKAWGYRMYSDMLATLGIELV